MDATVSSHSALKRDYLFGTNELEESRIHFTEGIET